MRIKRYTVQYLSIRGNHGWCPQGHEFEPMWADADGMTFDGPTAAVSAMDALLARNPDFPAREWRVVERVTTERVIRGEGAEK